MASYRIRNSFVDGVCNLSLRKKPLNIGSGKRDIEPSFPIVKARNAYPGKPRGYVEKQPIKENSKPRKAANKRKREEGDSRANKRPKRQPKAKPGGKPKGRKPSKRKREDGSDRPKKKLNYRSPKLNLILS